MYIRLEIGNAKWCIELPALIGYLEMKCACHAELLCASRDVYPIAYDTGQDASRRASTGRKQGIQWHHHGTSSPPPSGTAIEGAAVDETKGVEDDVSKDITLTEIDTRQIPELPLSIYSLYLPAPINIPFISVPPRRKFVWVWSCVSIMSHSLCKPSAHDSC